jgi:hypothetical protein
MSWIPRLDLTLKGVRIPVVVDIDRADPDAPLRAFVDGVAHVKQAGEDEGGFRARMIASSRETASKVVIFGAVDAQFEAVKEDSP